MAAGELFGGDVLAAGESVGGFEVLRKIGSGGMAQVYAAFDKRLGRNVALKVAALPEFSAYLANEARGLAAVLASVCARRGHTCGVCHRPST